MLMGRNGMGKTTTVRAIFGLLRPAAGSIRIDGREMAGAPPHLIGRAGLGLVPEGRQVFPTLTVEENLRATARAGIAGTRRWDLAAVLGLFPRLGERRLSPGASLSGGEQQMLAIGRALMTNPRLLVLDEATEGLAPLVRAEIWEALARLKAEGEAILVIDKTVAALARLADAHVILEKGTTVWRGRAADLAADPGVIDRHLHI
jgi:branched-chain amino acid transport system ATP-binding protein